MVFQKGEIMDFDHVHVQVLISKIGVSLVSIVVKLVIFSMRFPRFHGINKLCMHQLQVFLCVNERLHRGPKERAECLLTEFSLDSPRMMSLKSLGKVSEFYGL